MNTILLILTLTVLVGATTGGIILAVKYKINTNVLISGIDKTKTVLNFIEILLKDTKKFDKQMIENISDTVMYTLLYIKTVASDTTKDEKINIGLGYIKELLADMEITLTEDEEIIVLTILTVAYNVYDSIENK